MYKKHDALHSLMMALLCITNEYDITIFSDVLFDKAHDLYSFIFYTQYPGNNIHD